jgi:hypothetical protein
MRSLCSILILLSSFSVQAEEASIKSISITEARGLVAGSCYEEVGAVSCEKGCVVDFFPTTQAQLSLPVGKISAESRQKLGRIFNIRFRILRGHEVFISKLTPLTDRQLQDKLRKASGLFHKIACK